LGGKKKGGGESAQRDEGRGGPERPYNRSKALVPGRGEKMRPCESLNRRKHPYKQEPNSGLHWGGESHRKSVKGRAVETKLRHRNHSELISKNRPKNWQRSRGKGEGGERKAVKSSFGPTERRFRRKKRKTPREMPPSEGASGTRENHFFSEKVFQ